MGAHLAGHTGNRVLGRGQGRRKGRHDADALSEPDGLAAHLFIHADDGNAEILRRVLCAVRDLAHGRAEVQHRVHALFHGLHIHADQTGGRSRGHIARCADIRKNARILQGEHLHILAQLLLHFALHIGDQLGCGAGINQSDFHIRYLVILDSFDGFGSSAYRFLCRPDPDEPGRSCKHPT